MSRPRVRVFTIAIVMMELMVGWYVKGSEHTIGCQNREISTFPSSKCTNSSSIVKLYLYGNNIQYVDEGMFSRLSNLSDLSLNRNGLQEIAKGSFDNLTSLRILDLGNNHLTNLPEFNVVSGITYLTMSNNPIAHLSVSILKNYPDLTLLDLSGTRITQLQSDIFRYNDKLVELHLSNTPLEYIDENAFRGISLQSLLADGTKISHLPSMGMGSIIYLNISKASSLWQLPFKALKQLQKVRVEYHFHCCLLKKLHNPFRISKPDFKNFTRLPLCNNTNDTLATAVTPTTTQPRTIGPQPTTDDDPFKHAKDRFPTDKNETVIYKPTLGACIDSSDTQRNHPPDAHPAPPLVCLPGPDAFNPCEDIMGTMGLRVCSWVVAVFATLGNGLQLVVLATSRRSAMMYRVLMSNLAIANLFMGLYLGMVVSADAHTYGEYQNHARAWQFGTGCDVAGFLSILSTELAVYTLTIITLERYYTIVHPLKNDMHLSIKQITILMSCGWIFALTLATLPLVGVSSYDKVAICLPFNVEDGVATAYVTFLLITNGLAFLSVLFCYGRMYCSLGGARCSNASRVEGRVAKRMALLVISNFACWFPIALFSLIAIYGTPVIDVSASKFLLVFIYPINAFSNPYLYALGTKHFQLDILDLIKRFGICQKRIDKLSSKLMDQLASLPNTSKVTMGSKLSLNSYRVSPHNSVSGSPSESQRRSVRSKASSTNSKESSVTSCRFLRVPGIGFSSCRKQRNKRYSSDLDSNGVFDSAVETAPLQRAGSESPSSRNHMKLRRSSAREIIIAGAMLSKVACNCSDAKHTMQECRQMMDHKNENTDPPGEGQINGKHVQMEMVTPC